MIDWVVIFATLLLVALIGAILLYQKREQLIPPVLERAKASSGPLTHVLNFRDLGGLSAGPGRRVKTGIIFRTGAPTNASKEDIEYLVDKLNIYTLIDFRNLEEVVRHPEIEEGFEDRFTESALDDSSAAGRRHYRVPLNSLAYLAKVQSSAPLSVKMRCMIAGLFGKKLKVLMVLRYLATVGLPHMYITTAEYMKLEICTIMKAALQGQSPTMIFCQLGKDRTGISSALLLSVFGVPRDLIAEDYAKSDGNVSARDMHIMKKYLNEDFAKAPRKNIETFLDHIERNYGSISAYLESAGFSLQEQKKLREKYTEPTK